jgi:hypothetical protein
LFTKIEGEFAFKNNSKFNISDMSYPVSGSIPYIRCIPIFNSTVRFSVGILKSCDLILGQQMQEISAYTFTYEAFPEAMGMLWKRMLVDSKQVE